MDGNPIRRNAHPSAPPRKAVIVDHVQQDVIYRDNHIRRSMGCRVPHSTRRRLFFGTLCAIDPKPHQLNTPEIISSSKCSLKSSATIPVAKRDPQPCPGSSTGAPEWRSPPHSGGERPGHTAGWTPRRRLRLRRKQN